MRRTITRKIGTYLPEYYILDNSFILQHLIIFRYSLVRVKTEEEINAISLFQNEKWVTNSNLTMGNN